VRGCGRGLGGRKGRSFETKYNFANALTSPMFGEKSYSHKSDARTEGTDDQMGKETSWHLKRL